MGASFKTAYFMEEAWNPYLLIHRNMDAKKNHLQDNLVAVLNYKYNLFHDSLPFSSETIGTETDFLDQYLLLQDSPYRFHAIPKAALSMRIW